MCRTAAPPTSPQPPVYQSPLPPPLASPAGGGPSADCEGTASLAEVSRTQAGGGDQGLRSSQGGSPSRRVQFLSTEGRERPAQECPFCVLCPSPVPEAAPALGWRRERTELQTQGANFDSPGGPAAPLPPWALPVLTRAQAVSSVPARAAAVSAPLRIWGAAGLQYLRTQPPPTPSQGAGAGAAGFNQGFAGVRGDGWGCCPLCP